MCVSWEKECTEVYVHGGVLLYNISFVPNIVICIEISPWLSMLTDLFGASL